MWVIVGKRKKSLERLIIVGGGGFGRELICWAADSADAGRTPCLAGIIDDDPDALAGYDYQVAHLGSIEDFQPRRDDLLVLALGTPSTKRRIASKLAERGGRFGSLIHPTAIVAPTAKLGEGVILCPRSLVSADVALGRLVIVNVMSSIGHDARVGAYTTLSSHIDVTGFASIGDGVLLGTGAKILPKVKVGDGATIGAGAIVYRSVAPGATAYAAPAKVIRRS